MIHHPGQSVWIALPIDDDWDAYARLVAQGGRPVVAELRILPAPSGNSSYGLITAVLAQERDERGGAASDDWIELSPDSLPGETPAGGLTARALRRIRLGDATKLAYSALRGWLDEEALTPPVWLEREGFTLDAVGAPRRPGRKGRADRFYAEVAAAYVDALRRGSRQPVVGAAAALSEARGGVHKAAYVRDLLHVARGRGLLTRPPKGRAGGELTEKAIEALRHGEEKP